MDTQGNVLELIPYICANIKSKGVLLSLFLDVGLVLMDRTVRN